MLGVRMLDFPAMVSDTVDQLERLVPESTVPRVGVRGGAAMAARRSELYASVCSPIALTSVHVEESRERGYSRSLHGLPGRRLAR